MADKVTLEGFVALERQRLPLVAEASEIFAHEQQNCELTDDQVERLDALKPEVDAINGQIAALVAAYDAEIQAGKDAKHLASVAMMEAPSSRDKTGGGGKQAAVVGSEIFVRRSKAPEDHPVSALWDAAIAKANAQVP